MIVKKSRQIAVIKLCVFVLASLQIGKFILLPIINNVPEGISAFICGASALIVVISLFQIALGLRVGGIMASRVKLIFPGAVAELKKIGVENELDFSYAML